MRWMKSALADQGRHSRLQAARPSTNSLNLAKRNGLQSRVSLQWHSLPGRSRARWRGDTGEQDGENAGEENAVERPGAADRGDRRAKVGDLVQIEKIGADQRSH